MLRRGQCAYCGRSPTSHGNAGCPYCKPPNTLALGPKVGDPRPSYANPKWRGCDQDRDVRTLPHRITFGVASWRFVPAWEGACAYPARWAFVCPLFLRPDAQYLAGRQLLLDIGVDDARVLHAALTRFLSEVDGELTTSRSAG